MKVRWTFTLFFVFVFYLLSFCQNAELNGQVFDKKNQEPMIGATVKIGSTGSVTDFDGKFKIQLPPGDYTLEVSYVGYQNYSESVSFRAGEVVDLTLELEENATLLSTATVTSGKYEKPLGELTVSLEVVRPQLIESVNTVSVDEVLQKVPGVDIIDGQANIRGGSGFSYGAGSRVLLLVDDIPILQADAGYPQWNDIPVENIEQIEVVKGAASSLYGSSALNGIINIRTAYATSKPVTKISSFYTLYDDPGEAAQVWSDKQPYQWGANLSHRQKINRLDVVVGALVQRKKSYNRDTYEEYQRGNLGLRFRQNAKLSYGFNSNFNPGKSGDFFFWKSLDSLFVGSDNTIATSERFRFNIDPFVTYYDPSGSRHKLLGRYYFIDNNNNMGQSNASQLWYSEYQFQKTFQKINLVTTAGLVYTGNKIVAELYGDTTFSARNLAGFIQLDQKLFDRLNASLGFRFEHNTLFAPELFNCRTDFFTGRQICDTIPDGKIIESKPVWRAGLNYQVAEYSFIRASWGQGYRFPTVAESFITTTFGGIPILPNPRLQSETGWSAELGIKQGFRLLDFDGFFDLAIFWNEYNDMMEFNFSPDPFNFGFQSQNVGGTVIKGVEATVAGKGSFFGLPTNILAGYTYLDPKFQQFDLTPSMAGDTLTEGQLNAQRSSLKENFLKYRFQHTLKVDVESSWKFISLGISYNYNSNMKAVDAAFESLIVPGLRTYRAENNSGTNVLGARLGFKFWKEHGKLSIIVNNITNRMYSFRPGLMEAPRNYTARVDWKF